MKIRIHRVTGTEMHHRYPVESEPQGCFVELDPRTLELRAAYDPQIGSGVPAAVGLGHVLRWPVPPLRADAANALLEELVPLAARVAAGYSSRWDGNDHLGAYTADAQEATEEIGRLCDATKDDASTRLVVWQASEWFAVLGHVDVVARELGITASTTDEELDRLVAQEEATVARGAEVDEVEGLGAYLRKIRDDLRVEALRTAESELARLRQRPAAGRPAEKAGDERSRLIARACKARGMTRGELADTLSKAVGATIDQSRLSPSGVFAEAHREQAMAALRQLAAAAPSGNKGPRKNAR